MSTHAHIAICEDGRVRSVYCHDDGAILAQTLLSFYHHEHQVKNLIEAGQMRHLRRTVGKIHSNTYNDFREETKAIEEFETKDSWFAEMYSRDNISFLYLYECKGCVGMWWSWKREGDWWKVRDLRQLTDKPYLIKSEDYHVAQSLGVTSINRWEDGVSHHLRSERLMSFLKEHDFLDYDDHFCWKSGGDGDNGEALMYQLDAFFEMLDKTGSPF